MLLLCESTDVCPSRSNSWKSFEPDGPFPMTLRRGSVGANECFNSDSVTLKEQKLHKAQHRKPTRKNRHSENTLSNSKNSESIRVNRSNGSVDFTSTAHIILPHENGQTIHRITRTVVSFVLRIETSLFPVRKFTSSSRKRLKYPRVTAKSVRVGIERRKRQV